MICQPFLCRPICGRLTRRVETSCPPVLGAWRPDGRPLPALPHRPPAALPHRSPSPPVWVRANGVPISPFPNGEFGHRSKNESTVNCAVRLCFLLVLSGLSAWIRASRDGKGQRLARRANLLLRRENGNLENAAARSTASRTRFGVALDSGGNPLARAHTSPFFH